LVLADDDQALAAEPSFHSNPPKRGRSGVTAIRRFSNHRPELPEQQPENGLALAFGPAQTLCVVAECATFGRSRHSEFLLRLLAVIFRNFLL
jgi:hypothetical protein